MYNHSGSVHPLQEKMRYEWVGEWCVDYLIYHDKMERRSRAG